MRKLIFAGLLATAFAGLLLTPSAQTVISNNAADMANHIVMVADSTTGRTVTNAFTFTGLQTFNRGAAAPFAVNGTATKVANLDADSLDGQTGTYYNDPANLTSAVPVTKGGTGLASGTSGGIPYFSAGTTIASSAALGANAIVLGGGAGTTPATNANVTINSSNQLGSTTQNRCIAFHNTTQSINNGTETVLNMNSEDVDVGTMHDNATNNSRCTIPTGGDGFYEVCGRVHFTSNATGDRMVRVFKNGASFRFLSRINTNGTDDTHTGGCVFMTLVATDYIEITGFQASGGSLSVGTATRSGSNEISVVRLW